MFILSGEMIFNAQKLRAIINLNLKDFELSIPSYDNVKLHGILFKIKTKGVTVFIYMKLGALDTWGNIASIYDLGYDIFYF
jgi:hypothetical protein